MTRSHHPAGVRTPADFERERLARDAARKDKREQDRAEVRALMDAFQAALEAEAKGEAPAVCRAAKQALEGKLLRMSHMTAMATGDSPDWQMRELASFVHQVGIWKSLAAPAHKRDAARKILIQIASQITDSWRL